MTVDTAVGQHVQRMRPPFPHETVKESRKDKATLGFLWCFDKNGTPPIKISSKVLFGKEGQIKHKK